MSLRLFVALELPDDLRARLAQMQYGLADAKWVAPENLHLTLRFIGNVSDDEYEPIALALQKVEAHAFSLSLRGLNHFGNNKPRAVWVDVIDCPALIHLADKVEVALQRMGLSPEQRKFTPHITLARFKKSSPAKIGDYLSAQGDFTHPPITIDHFTLYSSVLGHSGPTYRVEHQYPLKP